MKYSYYPGCSMTTTGREYGKSLNYVNKQIGIAFEEIPDWNCCGATSGHTLSHELGVALPARNIAICEKQGLGLPIAVPCAECYNRMQHANHAARGEEHDKLERLVGMQVQGNLDIVTIMEVYSTPEAKEAIKKAVKKPLTGLKLACYYGCLYARPPKIVGKEGNPENPMAIDEVVRLTGAETVDWAFKTECCGASHHVDIPEVARKLLYRIFRNARDAGAQGFVVACPMCMMNLDMRQGAVNMAFGEDFDMPVYFISEILAVAMGGKYSKVGVSTHFHPAVKLMKAATSVKEVQ